MGLSPTGKSLSSAVISAASSGANELVAAQGAGLRIVVYSISLMTRGVTTAQLKSASTAISGALSFGTGGTWDEPINASGEPLYQTAANEALNLVLGSAVQCDGLVRYLVK